MLIIKIMLEWLGLSTVVSQIPVQDKVCRTVS